MHLRSALWDLYKGNKDAMGRAYRTFRTGVGAMLTVGTAGAKDKTDAIRQKGASGGAGIRPGVGLRWAGFRAPHTF